MLGSRFVIYDRNMFIIRATDIKVSCAPIIFEMSMLNFEDFFVIS